MRKLLMALLALTFSLYASFAYATVGVEDDGTYECEAVVLNFSGADLTNDGSKVTIYTSEWTSTGQARAVPFGLLGWYGVEYYLGVGQTSGASPYYVDVSGGADYIVFKGTGTSPVQTQTGSPIERTFRVPDDYDTTSTFVVYAQNSDVSYGEGASTPNYIDWDIVVNRGGVAVSSTRYDQTPVALSADTNIQAVTLTYATPSDLVAGDIVTLRIWRVYEATQSATGRDATSDLRVYDVAFRYVASW